MAEPCEYSLTTKKNNSEKIEMISQELTKPHTRLMRISVSFFTMDMRRENARSAGSYLYVPEALLP